MHIYAYILYKRKKASSVIRESNRTHKCRTYGIHHKKDLSRNKERQLFGKCNAGSKARDHLSIQISLSNVGKVCSTSVYYCIT